MQIACKLFSKTKNAVVCVSETRKWGEKKGGLSDCHVRGGSNGFVVFSPSAFHTKRLLPHFNLQTICTLLYCSMCAFIVIFAKWYGSFWGQATILLSQDFLKAASENISRQILVIYLFSRCTISVIKLRPHCVELACCFYIFNEKSVAFKTVYVESYKFP